MQYITTGTHSNHTLTELESNTAKDHIDLAIIILMEYAGYVSQ